MRIIAVDANGQEHAPSGTRSVNAFGAGTSQVTATFQNLPLKQIKHFRLQTRPYQWVFFRKVPLHPGHGPKTNVQVDVGFGMVGPFDGILGGFDPGAARLPGRYAVPPSAALLNAAVVTGAARLPGMDAVPRPTLHIHLLVSVLELDQAKIRAARFDLKRLGVDPKAGPQSGSDSYQVLKPRAADELVRALREEKLARTVAEPTLVTLSGRAAHFQCSEGVPPERLQDKGTNAMEWMNCGTQARCPARGLGQRPAALGGPRGLGRAEAPGRRGERAGPASAPAATQCHRV